MNTQSTNEKPGTVADSGRVQRLVRPSFYDSHKSKSQDRYGKESCQCGACLYYDSHCEKCGGDLVDSIGYLPQMAATDEHEGCSQHLIDGQGKLLTCKKCKGCGHSFIA